MSFNKRWNDKASHDVIRIAIIEFLVLIIFNFFRDTIFSFESHSLLLNKTPFMSWRVFFSLLESRHLNIFQDFAWGFFSSQKNWFHFKKAFDHRLPLVTPPINVHRCSLKLDLPPTRRLLWWGGVVVSFSCPEASWHRPYYISQNTAGQSHIIKQLQFGSNLLLPIHLPLVYSIMAFVR